MILLEACDPRAPDYGTRLEIRFTCGDVSSFSIISISWKCVSISRTSSFFQFYKESLSGQVVWITGASSGIGEYTAYCLSKAGCKLVLSARREDELERVKAECLKAGKGRLSTEDILVLVLDYVKTETHKDAVQRVLRHFGRIDVLLNNAGVAQRASWMDIDLRVDKELFEINVLGPVSLSQQVLPHMVERKKGHIVVVSSIAGKLGLPHSRSYNGSKYALQGYFECLRTEMGEHNIDISVICPGPVFSNAFTHAATFKYGEKLGRKMAVTEQRVSTERCAYLIAVTIANKLYESWITLHPWLILLYVSQWFPDLVKWIFLKYGTTQLMKKREGN